MKLAIFNPKNYLFLHEIFLDLAWYWEEELSHLASPLICFCILFLLLLNDPVSLNCVLQNEMSY
jgi:hypothetical protein